MRFIIPFIFATALLCRAENPAEGRWEGSIKIPERELKLIVDLAQEKSGAWIGSITLPGLSVKGSALGDITLKDSELSFSIQSALGRLLRRHRRISLRDRVTPDVVVILSNAGRLDSKDLQSIWPVSGYVSRVRHARMYSEHTSKSSETPKPKNANRHQTGYWAPPTLSESATPR